MSTRKMVRWYDVKWATGPNLNERMNPLEFDFSGPTIDIIPAELAGIRAAKEIAATHPGPYALLASGGVDSQAMIWYWHLSGIPFKVIHYSYNNALNAEDTRTLVEFCCKAGIPFEVRMYDAFGFIQSMELVDYAKEFDCNSPQIITYMKLVEHHPDETVVMSGNYITPDKCGNNYTIDGLQRYANQAKSNFVPFYLSSTPELAYAFWVDELNAREMSDTHKTYNNKIQAYRNSGVPVVRQADKLTGFEEMKLLADSFKVPSTLKLKYAQMPSRRPFDLLYRYALLDRIPKYTESVTITHNQCIKELQHAIHHRLR